MKTHYRYIHFVKEDTYWICYNNKTDDELGWVHLENGKRGKKCWYFEGYENCDFDTSCLTDIIHFMNQLKE